MELLVKKFSKGKYENENELFAELISEKTVKLMGEMIALQSLRTIKKYDFDVSDKLYVDYIKDLHHMGERDYVVTDGYDCAQIAICLSYRFEIVSAELLAEKVVLHSDTHFLCPCIEISNAFKFARHRAVRDIEYAVKMQSVLFGRAFPDSYISPAFP